MIYFSPRVIRLLFRGLPEAEIKQPWLVVHWDDSAESLIVAYVVVLADGQDCLRIQKNMPLRRSLRSRLLKIVFFRALAFRASYGADS